MAKNSVVNRNGSEHPDIFLFQNTLSLQTIISPIRVKKDKIEKTTGKKAHLITTITSQKTGSNCYVLAEQGHALIIDPDDTKRILRFLRETRLRPDRILLTHEHFDHIGAVDALRELYRIPLLCSLQTSENITSEKMNLSIIYDLYVFEQSGIVSSERHPAFRLHPAEETFEEEISLSFFEHTLHLKRIPGHSPGSTLIQLDDTIFFTGDYGILGQSDNLSLPGGNPAEYEAYTKPVLQKIPAGSTIYPGHGGHYKAQEKGLS